MVNKVKISVIIPNYNNGIYLEECINSVLNQTIEDIEIIIIDDCSRDNSRNILQLFQSRYPNKIKVIENKENSGAGLSRNNGLDIATGEFIKFLDADDTMDEDVLESMYNAAKEHNVKIVTGQLKVIGDKEERIVDRTGKADRKIDISRQREELVFGSAGIGDELFARELFKDIRFPKLKWEDFATIPAIKALANDIYEMNKVVYNYRVHDTSTTSTDLCKKTPRIFDIVYCLRNLRELIPEQYKEELDAIEVIHYGMRMREVASWQDCSEEHKKILINSLQRIIELEVPDYKMNKYVKEPEQPMQLSSFVVEDIMQADIGIEQLYEQLEQYGDNLTVADIIEKIKTYGYSQQEHKEDEEIELIENSLVTAEQIITSEEYSEDDKRRLITLLYQALSKTVVGFDNKIYTMRTKKNQFNNREDDTRHYGLTKKVKSYLEEGYIDSDSVETILEDVQKILTSEEFLKYPMYRTTIFALSDPTITPEDIGNSEQHERNHILYNSEKNAKGVDFDG